MTGSTSEVCRLERKKVFSPKFASQAGEIKKKSPGQWIGNKGIFHVSLTLSVVVGVQPCIEQIPIKKKIVLKS